MPHIQSTFKGNKWTKNKHLETMIPALFRKVLINYNRERVNLPDGDFIDLDWVKNNNTCLVILFHGLEGSSESQYIKGCAEIFGQNGFDVCAVNWRSCSGENNNLITSYHSGVSHDIELIIKHITANYPYQKIVLGGFSLGGNVLLKYLGENKTSALIKAAFAFSVPIDLAGSADVLSKFSNKPYMTRFLKSMNKKIYEKAVKFPGKIDVSNLHKITTFKEWDTLYTAKIHGFDNAEHYYKECSALLFLPQIKLPTLLVNAQNDPFLSSNCFPIDMAKEHPFLYLETPRYGGHVGFAVSNVNGEYYSETTAINFVNQFIHQ